MILLHFHPIDIGYGRYNACLAHFVPWLQRYYNHLTPQVLLEIGAGTGSSTAAFARMCGEKTGYDFDESALEFARLDRADWTDGMRVLPSMSSIAMPIP